MTSARNLRLFSFCFGDCLKNGWQLLRETLPREISYAWIKVLYGSFKFDIKQQEQQLQQLSKTLIQINYKYV